MARRSREHALRQGKGVRGETGRFPRALVRVPDDQQRHEERQPDDDQRDQRDRAVQDGHHLPERPLDEHLRRGCVQARARERQVQTRAGLGQGQDLARGRPGRGQLRSAAVVERLEVRWPAGSTEVFRNVAANQLLTIREGDGIVARKPLNRP